MKLELIKPGRYLLAVSGGVDSMVLLDVLRLAPEIELSVAHFDHGIRPDSYKDARLVEEVCTQYQVPYFKEVAELGPDVSEAMAREARYAFLQGLMQEHHFDGLITAHHADDIIETALINTIRGTGWRGYVAMQTNTNVIRPLQNLSKGEIITYAKERGLTWREDSTNADTTYLRNYLRLNVLQGANEEREQLKEIVKKQESLEGELRSLLSEVVESLKNEQGEVKRYEFIMLPYDIACEVVRELLDMLEDRPEISRALIERMVRFIKTAQLQKRLELGHGWFLQAELRSVAFCKY